MEQPPSDEVVGRRMSVAAEKTECPLVNELSNCLKENSRSGIVSCLTRIKTDEKCSRRLLENGGVCLLVELLRYRNTRVMDATLSILANACLMSHIREKVEGTKIASYVVWIVKHLESGETMHCRACRLMGNLSESNTHARDLCEAGAIIALRDILCSKSNVQTLGMAVRAIRNIWTNHEGSRDEILEAGTIKEITCLLVKSRKKIVERENDAKYVELGESCLKAMYAFADFADPRSDKQMRGEKGLHGYRCIVDYCRANNKTAIKCLYKLCLYAGRRPDLGNSGAVECLVDAVRASNSNFHDTREQRNPSIFHSSSTFWESLVSLCLLCREAVNRAKMRRGSGLEAILGLLGQVQNEKYHTMLLHALAQFVCDNLSIDIMVKNGLIDVLVDKLKKMSVDTRTNDGERKDERDRKNGKKRSADTSPYGRGDTKYHKTGYQYGRFSLDYPRDDWSPGGTSTSYSSPPSTPPLITCDTNSEIDENADDNYSPICSDNEWLENDDTNDVQIDGESTARSRGNRDDEKEDEDVFMEEENAENSDYKYQEDYEDEHQQGSTSTLALLSMLSHSSVPIDRLADPATIQALVGYIAAAKNNRASIILTRIIRNHAYFVSLLLQGFVFEAQTLYGSELYTRALCDIAETGGAFGEMATLLLRGQDTQKAIVAISIPYMIKSREKLRILLKHHGGLELIYRVMEKSENSMYDCAVLAICRLADSLDVSPPERRKNEEIVASIAKTSIDDDDYSTNSEESSCMVVFELDDGSTVEVCRTRICEKSAVFTAMLEGNFSESGKSHVRLRKASRGGLTTLLKAASGEYDFTKGKIEALLDAVLLADKFLMSEISDYLTERSMARISHENLCRAWNWSRENDCHELRICCVKIFLSSTMTRTNRLRAFRDFYESPSFREFIEDTRDIIDDSLALPKIFQTSSF